MTKTLRNAFPGVIILVGICICGALALFTVLSFAQDTYNLAHTSCDNYIVTNKFSPKDSNEAQMWIVIGNTTYDLMPYGTNSYDFFNTIDNSGKTTTRLKLYKTMAASCNWTLI